MTIRVLLVDDQPLLRLGFRMVLEAQTGILVVGEASSGAEAVRLCARLRPNVIMMDVRMPGMDGIAATERIAAADSSAKVLILTTFDLDEYAFAGLRAGASGFLLKSVEPAELVNSVRAVAAGDAVVAPRITRELLNKFAHKLPSSRDHNSTLASIFSQLTDREREVLMHVAQGLSNAEIAAALMLSEATVKTHVSRVLTKLALRDRVQAVVLAYETGLVRRA
ncbi:MAG: DNA-binding response regulator [Acidimicrobiales bacterium]|nr:MAG: DNA-binding response regulator [Acidimicrobiales bacterium]